MKHLFCLILVVSFGLEDFSLAISNSTNQSSPVENSNNSDVLDQFALRFRPGGKTPAEIVDIDSISRAILSNPEMEKELYSRGIRVLLPKSLKAKKDEIRQALIDRLRQNGINPRFNFQKAKWDKFQIEFVEWNRAVSDAADGVEREETIPAEETLRSTENVQQRVTTALRKFFIETGARAKKSIMGIPALAATTVKAIPQLPMAAWESRQMPSRDEFLVGVASKAIPISVSLATYFHTYYPEHLAAMLLASTLTFGLDTFHGIFCATWNNFMKRLTEVSPSFMALFTLAYGKSIAVTFRTIAYKAGVARDPVISMEFLTSTLFQDIVGGYSGARGFMGVTKLADKGVISYQTRNILMQMKDVIMMLGSLNFYMGQNRWWIFFLTERGIDLLFYRLGEKADFRRLLTVVPKELLAEKPALDADPNVEALVATVQRALEIDEKNAAPIVNSPTPLVPSEIVAASCVENFEHIVPRQQQ